MILKENPTTGTPLEDFINYRDLSFSNGEYIIRYRKDTEGVIIVRIRHSKENYF